MKVISVKKIGTVFVAIGGIALLAAVLLYMHNASENRTAGKTAGAVAAALEERIAAGNSAAETEKDAEQTAEATEEEETTDEDAVGTVEVNGYDYIGYLEIPSLNLKLPVMSEWDYARLRIAPCRQFGSAETDDLVIAGHNYSSHFGRLKDLSVGDRIRFTDTDGLLITYTVSAMETVQPTDVPKVQDSGYALVLYTCTYGGASRVVVYCNRND